MYPWLGTFLWSVLTWVYIWVNLYIPQYPLPMEFCRKSFQLVWNTHPVDHILILGAIQKAHWDAESFTSSKPQGCWKKEFWELHCALFLHSPDCCSWKCKIACWYRSHFRRPKLCKPLRQMGLLEDFLLLISLPMKAAENLVAKEGRLLPTFVSSMAPETSTRPHWWTTSFSQSENCGAFSGYEAVMNHGWKLSSQLTKDN